MLSKRETSLDKLKSQRSTNLTFRFCILTFDLKMRSSRDIARDKFAFAPRLRFATGQAG